jgi:hypothetical protein
MTGAWPRLLPWGVVAAGLLLHAWAMWDGFFHMDDFFYLADAQRDFLSYVFQIYNGHLMPFGFAIVWLSQAVAPMSWALAVLVSLALWAAFLTGVVFAMKRAFGDSGWVTVVTALMAFAPLLTTVTVWYASALQILPWGAACAWMLYFAIRDAQDHRPRWVVGFLVSYVVGLLFWEKAILALPVVVWLAWRYWPGTGRVGLGGLGGRWWIPAVSTAITAGYALVYLAAQPEAVLRSDPSVSQLVESLRVSLGEVWLPAYFGAPWTGFGDGLVPGTTSAWWAFALVWQIVAAMVILSVVRWRPALNAWVVMAGYAAVTVVLFAFGRINEFGLVLAYDPRYVEDLFIVGALVLPFAFQRPRGSTLAQPRSLAWLRAPQSPWVPIVIGVVLVNLLVLPSVAIGSSWHDSEAKRYVASVRAALESQPGVPVLDRKVPPGVMAPLFLERANASYVLSGLKVDVPWDGSGPRVLALAEDGTLRDPVLAPSSTSVPGWDGACGWKVVGGPTSVEMDTTLFDWVWVGTIDYLASGSGAGSVVLDGDAVEVPFAEGLHQATFVVVGSGDTLTVTPPPGVGLCVTEVVLSQVDYGAMEGAAS